MVDFLFVYPHKELDIFSGCTYHIGASYIISYSKYPKNIVGIFTTSNKESLSQISKHICETASKCVGFTVYDANYDIAKELALNIRKEKKDLKIIFGGPTATTSAIPIMRDCHAIDACILGEGEEIFKLLFNGDFELTKIQSTKGLIKREDLENKFLDELINHRALIATRVDLSKSISPYLSGVLPFDIAPTLGLYSARGCTNKCTYCSFAALSSYKVQFYSDKIFIKEILKISEHFSSKKKNVIIPINDDTFTANLKRCEEILRQLSKFSTPYVKYWLDIRADQIKEVSFFHLAKNAGVDEINFGLESSSPEVLATVRKARNNPTDDLTTEKKFIQKVEWAVNQASKHGIKATVSIITGLPNDNLARSTKTVNFVKKLPVVAYSHNYLHIFNGTTLQKNYEKYGIVRKKHANSPFLSTDYNFDIKKVPVLPHDTHVFDYRRGTLLLSILALSGSYAFLAKLDIPRIILNNNSSLIKQIRYNRNTPSGTVFIHITKEGNPKNSVIPNHFNIVISKNNGGYIANKNYLRNNEFIPVIHINDASLNNSKNNKLHIFFTKPVLNKIIYHSNINRWIVPFGACGLLPGNCPLQTTQLESLSKNHCPFYGKIVVQKNKLKCNNCHAKDDCPKCTFLINSNSEDYCSYHQSKQSWKLRNYIFSLLHVLESRDTDLSNMPNISVQDITFKDYRTNMILIGNTYYIIRNDKIYNAPKKLIYMTKHLSG